MHSFAYRNVSTHKTRYNGHLATCLKYAGSSIAKSGASPGLNVDINIDGCDVSFGGEKGEVPPAAAACNDTDSFCANKRKQSIM